MKQKLLGYVLIVLPLLTFALVTPQAFAEKPQGKVGKTMTQKDHKQTRQLQIIGTLGAPDAATTIDDRNSAA